MLKVIEPMQTEAGTSTQAVLPLCPRSQALVPALSSDNVLPILEKYLVSSYFPIPILLFKKLPSASPKSAPKPSKNPISIPSLTFVIIGVVINCPKLEHVYHYSKKTLNSIHETVFNYCKKLTNIYVF